ncbi:MAG TPA: CrcB family protein [Spirochaetales bacterium]|nr:CrcB family protein [Spirochaetales bacterium]
MKGLRDALLVFAGGGLGSLLRWLVALGASAALPVQILLWATLAVNLAGSFAIGVAGELVGAGRLPRETRLALVTGLLGGFTTLSALSLETAGYLRGGHPIRAAIYPVFTVAAGALLCLAGMRLVRR